MGGSSSIIQASGSFHGVMPDPKEKTLTTSRSQRQQLLTSSMYSNVIQRDIQSLLDTSVDKLCHQNSTSTVSIEQDCASDTHLHLQGREVEHFDDSVHVKGALSPQEATELFDYFQQIGEKMRPKDTSAACKAKSRYPLWSSYYGCARALDGALALDRWGSQYETYLKTEEPPEVLLKAARKLRVLFGLQDEECALNSMLVNYYFSG
eukprot:gene46182-56541_t